MASIHQFEVERIGNGSIDFAEYKGKKILVVNLASECMYTPQYQQLQDLYSEYRDQMEIIGFPCNDFGNQEPGDEEQIKGFCERNFGVTFPLARKIRIKGDDPHPVYAWLTRKELNGVADSRVQWNFQKYLLDEEGRLIDVFEPAVEPADERILSHFS